jgi:putative transposase
MEVIMRKSTFSEYQIIEVLKRAEQGVAVKDICRELGVSVAAFYQWRSKYDGIGAPSGSVEVGYLSGEIHSSAVLPRIG